MPTKVEKILIANRGEIAVRVIKTCKKLGFRTVGVFSEADTNAVHVQLADESYFIGPSESKSSYLCIEKLIQAAHATNANFIHPGYGFLSENSEFSAACEKAGITFIGPSAEAIRVMGSKIEAKNILSARSSSSSAPIPLIPGYNGADQSVARLKQEVIKIGFPVLLKASAGGGGKGMVVVRDADTLDDQIESAKSVALNAFGDDQLLVEKFFEQVRHVEVQIFGDKHGNVMHIFERECSVQRRHQKVIEETPSPLLTPELRQRMTTAAVEIARTIDYVGAGTVEFIVDESTLDFFFLEMNTRLQVEHPITEIISALDLVELQIDIARGVPLHTTNQLRPLKGEPLKMLNYHAIECRLYAEDPDNQFLPCTGRILCWKEADVTNTVGIRYDTGIETGSEISIYYDPMVSKLITFAETREKAIELMKYALINTVVLGVKTNKAFLLDILCNEKFVSGKYTTGLIDSGSIVRQSTVLPLESFGVAAMLYDWYTKQISRSLWKHVPSGFRNNPYSKQYRLYTVDEQLIRVNYQHQHDVDYQNGNDEIFNVILLLSSLSSSSSSSSSSLKVQLHTKFSHHSKLSSTITCSINGHRSSFLICHTHPDTLYVHHYATGNSCTLKRRSKLYSAIAAQTDENAEASYSAPMPSKILKVHVKDGDEVKQGDVLLTIESMKMEVRILARTDGKVKLLVSKDQLVEAGTLLVHIE